MRIVSLCPSLTELVFDLGRGADLVGRTKFCVHPADGIAAVESVGGTKNPKVERIVALHPDLVLLNEEENRREDAEALMSAGIRCHVSFPRTALDTAEMVRSIGTAIERPIEAERIAADIARRAEEVGARAGGEPRVSYAYLIWRRPLMTISDDTFVAAMLELPGGINVFGSNDERYPTITEEQLASSDPALVLLSTEPFPFSRDHAEELVNSTGLPLSRFRIVDGEYLSWHGSRTIAGIGYAERVIRGDEGRLT